MAVYKNKPPPRLLYLKQVLSQTIYDLNKHNQCTAKLKQREMRPSRHPFELRSLWHIQII
jgi:hypothetical protein